MDIDKTWMKVSSTTYKSLFKVIFFDFLFVTIEILNQLLI